LKADTSNLSDLLSFQALQEKFLLCKRPRDPPVLKSCRGKGSPYDDSALRPQRPEMSVEILNLVAQMVQPATVLKKAKNWWLPARRLNEFDQRVRRTWRSKESHSSFLQRVMKYRFVPMRTNGLRETLNVVWDAGNHEANVVQASYLAHLGCCQPTLRRCGGKR
jgi:hypothetical protein